jgi:hypothetical protein
MAEKVPWRAPASAENVPRRAPAVPDISMVQNLRGPSRQPPNKYFGVRAGSEKKPLLIYSAPFTMSTRTRMAVAVACIAAGVLGETSTGQPRDGDAAASTLRGRHMLRHSPSSSPSASPHGCQRAVPCPSPTGALKTPHHTSGCQIHRA